MATTKAREVAETQAKAKAEEATKAREAAEAQAAAKAQLRLRDS